MNDELAKQLVRQLKIINFWITSLGILLITGLVIIGIMLYQVFSFVKNTSESVSHLKESTTQNFDLKQKTCDGQGGFSDFIRNKTTACE